MVISLFKSASAGSEKHLNVASDYQMLFFILGVFVAPGGMNDGKKNGLISGSCFHSIGWRE